MPAAVTLCQRPSKSMTGSVHSRRMQLDLLLEAAAAVRGSSSPSASYSTGFQPMPRPRRKRAAGEHVDLRRLLREQRRLPLRRDDDAGDELEARARRPRGSRRARGSRGTCARRGTGRRGRDGVRRPRRARGRRRAGESKPSSCTACANSRTPPGSAPISVCGKTAPSFISARTREPPTMASRPSAKRTQALPLPS